MCISKSKLSRFLSRKINLEVKYENLNDETINNNYKLSYNKDTEVW